MTPASRLPIRPGTARKLGLRPPMSAGMFLFGREVSDETMDRVRQACDAWVERITAPATPCRWCDAGHVRPLAWWQRALHWAGWWP